MNNQLLYVVQALGIATVVLIAVVPEVLSSNTKSVNFHPQASSPSSYSKMLRAQTSKESLRPHAGSGGPTAAQRKTTQRQKRAPGTCDAHMKKIDGVCRTTANVVVLTNPIFVNAGDPPYDCKGNYLVPPILGGSTDPATDANRYQTPSSPQVAFFVPDAHNVHIRNCKIVGFDFGIFAIKGKTSAGSTVTNNAFDNNEIIAHYAGISLMDVDNTEVTNNTVTLTHLGGRAINVQWDSDRNTIRGNKLIGDFASSRTDAYAAPSTDASGKLVTVTSNPRTSKPHMVFIGTLQGAELPMLTAIVDGSIHQFRINPSPLDAEFSEDNTFEGNSITVNIRNVYDGLLLTLPRRTIVKGNTIYSDTKSAIRVSTQLGISRRFPGACSNDPNRRCFDDSECKLVPNVGGCVGVSGNQPGSSLWTSVDNTIEANTIYTPLSDMGIATAGRNTKIIGNNIELDPQTPTLIPEPLELAAIALFGESFGNKANPSWGATVTRNSVSSVWPAFGLVIRAPGQPQSPQDAFTARIGLNDFFSIYWLNNGNREPHYAVRVIGTPGSTSDQYNIPTDISINFSEIIPPTTKPISGNFWGLDCPQNPTNADWFFSSDSTPTLVTANVGIAPGVVVDDSKALGDTVVRTISSFQMPSQPSRCPRPTTEPAARRILSLPTFALPGDSTWRAKDLDTSP